jgi:alpha-beta hydrolase superfamily lysophospholipase
VLLEKRPDLNIWHEAELDAEFTVDSKAQNFADYLAIEEKLFAQLDERVYAKIKPEEQTIINRYHRGSLADPDKWSTNWNRTFEFATESPKAGVLLLHGMSDSPYSLRNIGKTLHRSGAWVVGLRIPGHGTAPTGLVEAKWEDMAAAVQLAAEHLKNKIGQQPLYIIGYSNGGALAVHYALAALEDSSLPSVNGLVLISPSIGVSGLAAFAVWQARLGHLLGLDKLAWNSILLEYDPFKYGSFAVNAGDQVHRLTTFIQKHLAALSSSDKLSSFPPVIAFQSVVDATVSTNALIQGLFGKLPEGGHELFLFDVNRFSEIEKILSTDPKQSINDIFDDMNIRFTISLVTNVGKESRHVKVRSKNPHSSDIIETDLGMEWPTGLYSLSHVALPFPIDDPLYGIYDSPENPGITLGNVELRGERGVLLIPSSDLIRQRWNPFYPYLEKRVLEFTDLNEN